MATQEDGVEYELHREPDGPMWFWRSNIGARSVGFFHSRDEAMSDAERYDTARIAAALGLDKISALVEASEELRRDMMERADRRVNPQTGEEYRLVNAGRSAWAGFTAALVALGDREVG